MKETGIIINASDGNGWDDYVLNHPKSFFYHLYGWGKALEEIFGFKMIYLQARAEGNVCGVLPLIMVDTLFKKKLISVPIGIYAGVLSSDAACGQMLIDEAVRLTRELDCEYLELRNLEKYQSLPDSKELYLTFIKELPKDPGECLERMPRKARAAARQSIDAGLSYDVDIKYLDICYEIYAANQKALGTPVMARKWFTKLAEIFKDNISVLVVRSGSRYVASVLTFFYKDSVLPFYGASLPGSEKYHPNNFMYLKLEEYCVMKGYRYFDFGRSRKGAGSYYFKINQGFEPKQLYYQYYLNKVKKLPEINPSNRLFDIPKIVWRALPLSVTKSLGPKIYKYVIP